MHHLQTRKILGALLLAVFLLGFPLPGAAGPPEIKEPIDKHLFSGNNIDEIKKYITKRGQEIDKIVKILNGMAREGRNSDKKERIASIKDIYLGLKLQYKILLSELQRSGAAPPVRPKVSGPPYKVADFSLILDYQRQVTNQLMGTNKQYIFIKNRLETLKNTAVSRLSSYSQLLQTHPEMEVTLYERYCKLLNLQNEYAILSLRKPRLEKLTDELANDQKFAAEWVSEAFSRLKITPEDIKKAQAEMKKAGDAYNAISRKNSAMYQDLSRRILVHEVHLNQFVAKINQAGAEHQPVDPLWSINKDRLDLAINTLQSRIQRLQEEKTSSWYKSQRATFRYQWLTSYSRKSKKKQLAQFIKSWDSATIKLNSKIDELTTSITNTSLARSDLTHRLVNIRSRLNNNKNPKIRKALGQLAAQAEKAFTELDQLAVMLTDDLHEIRNNLNGISQIINLTRYSISPKARVQVWGQVHYNDLKEKALDVLYYPLFSLGGSTINLYIILKIITFFLLGLATLRFIRRKIENLLAKRAKMSPGAINSITTLGYYASILLCSVVILEAAGLDLSQLGIIVGALGVGIGFGLQTITNNFISGIILLTEQSVKVGDYVTLEGGIIGEVRKMTIRSTVIRTAESEDIIVPNSDLISNQVRTWTYGDDWRRLNIPFGVSYDADPDEVVRLAEEAAREVVITREDFKHKIGVFFEGFGDNSLDFSLRVWCRMINLQAPAGLMTDYYFALFRKLKQAGIEIPFPQRDLHLQSLSPEFKKELAELLSRKPRQGPDRPPAIDPDGEEPQAPGVAGTRPPE